MGHLLVSASYRFDLQKILGIKRFNEASICLIGGIRNRKFKTLYVRWQD